MPIETWHNIEALKTIKTGYRRTRKDCKERPRNENGYQ